MRHHHENRLYRLRQSKNLRTPVLILFILGLLIAASPDVSITLAVAADGDEKFRTNVTKEVARRLNLRIREAKAIDVDVSPASSSTLKASFAKTPSGFDRMLLTAPGKFEIRAIRPNADLFQVVRDTFKNVTIRQSGGVRSMCTDTRKELNAVLKRVAGPDTATASFYHRGEKQWCAHALESRSIGNASVERIDTSKTLQGKRSLSIKIRPQDADRLAENGSIDVKTVGIVLDGDLLARSTVAQIKRIPIRIEPPESLSTDDARKRWLLVVRALIQTPVPMPVVLVED